MTGGILPYAAPNDVRANKNRVKRNKRKIILCRGIQGSGKSTWAKKWVLEDPKQRVRFNNDDIRNMLGEYWVPNREDIVLSIKNAFLTSSMFFGKDIVIDNMNLNPKEVEFYKNIIDNYNNPKGVIPDMVRNEYELEFMNFYTPLEVCIERDSKRSNPAGEGVIRATYEKYKDIIEIS